MREVKIFIMLSMCVLGCSWGEASSGCRQLVIEDTPMTLIREGLSQVERPEGVTFSPEGKFMATANSSGNTITFYARIGDEGCVYETVPAFSIKGKESKLNFPHDLSFSPDGRHLAVANRKGDSITVYGWNDDEGVYKNVPIAQIKGKVTRVNKPNSVRYSPYEPILAISNQGDHSIAFFHYQGGDYGHIPFQIIRDKSKRLSDPNSLDFSFDGEYLAVASLDTHSVLIYQRVEGKEVRFTSKPIAVIEGLESSLCYPHSVSFHPSGEFLAVTNAQGRKNVNIFQRGEGLAINRFAHRLSLDITEIYEESTIHLVEELHRGGGCKGVAFSPDGQALAVTQNLSGEYLNLPYTVGAIIVYEVENSD